MSQADDLSYDTRVSCAHGVRGGWRRDCCTQLYCPYHHGMTCQTESRAGFVVMIGGKSRFVGRHVDTTPAPPPPSCASSALACSIYLDDNADCLHDFPPSGLLRRSDAWKRGERGA